MKYLKVLFLSLISFLLFFSCDVSTSSSSEDVSSFYFEEEKISLAVGESVSVRCVLSGSGLSDKDVSFYPSAEGIISVSNISKSGCVVFGQSEGSTILIGKCKGRSCYLEIVCGEEESEIEPYIVVSNSVYKMNIGDKKTVIASLFGGSAEDANNFTWTTDSELISLNSVGSSCVIESSGVGVSRVCVTNPKSKYPAYFLVAVDSTEQVATYLSVDKNVVKIKSDGTSEINVSISNGNDSALLGVSYKVVEGSDCISLVPNFSSCIINGKKEGQAVIKISLSELEDLYVTVIVSDDVNKPYIEATDSFIISEGKNTYDIVCSVTGDVLSDVDEKYSFSVENKDIINVVQTKNVFHVETLKDGSSKIYVKNSYCEEEKIIQVIVSNTSLETNVKYISLSDTLVYLEEGGDEYTFYANLIGGNESDKNNFIWTVSDSSIIKAEVADGKVEYARSVEIEGENESYKASCVVTPVSSGTATIKVQNPKSDYPAYITFRVYPKGVLNKNKVYLQGDSFIKVIKGENQKVSLNVVNGDVTSFSEAEWKIEDTSIVSCEGVKKDGVLTGLKTGETILTVSSKDFFKDYSAKVLCGTEEELESMNALYTDTMTLNLEKNIVSYVEIKTLKDVDSSLFSVSSNDSTCVYARMSGSVLVLQGLKEGNTQVVVSHSDISENLILKVSVSDSSISYDYPYVLSYPSFCGVVVGETSVFEGSLLNAPESEKDSIEYKVEEGSGIEVKGNGESFSVSVKEETSGKIEVSHPKAKDKVYVYVYSALSEEELESKVILTSEKTNYICNVGDRLFLKALINQEDKKDEITWSCENIGLVNIDSSNDSCVVDTVGEGNVKIVASCNGSILNFFISIVQSTESNTNDFYVNAPSILEIVTGEIKKVTLSVGNVTSDEREEFKWTSNDETSLLVTGNALEASVKALKSGFYELYIENEKIGYEKTVSVVVKDTKDEFKNSYVLGLEKNRYTVKKGESIDVSVIFGTYSLPEEDWENIKWSVDNKCVTLTPNGKTCGIYGKNEGESYVTVTSKDCVNSVSFYVSVYSDEKSSLYSLSVQRIIKLVKNDYKDVTFTCVDSEGNEIKDYSSFKVSGYDESVISLASSLNFVRIQGLNEGSTNFYIEDTLRNINESVLVKVYEDETSMNNDFALSISQDSYLLEKGKTREVTLYLESYTADVYEALSVSSSDSNVCESSLENAVISLVGIEEGNAKISIFYNLKEVGSFTVYVAKSETKVSEKNILTQSIISLLVGESYKPSVYVSDNSDWDFDWNNYDGKEFSCVSSTDTKTLIGITEGKGELTLVSGDDERVLRIGVFESETDRKAFHQMNIDKRYWKMNVGDKINVSPVFYSDGNLEDTVYKDLDENEIFSFENDKGVLRLKAKKEGIGRVEVTNSDFDSITLIIEVRNENTTGYVVETDDSLVLTTNQDNVCYIENDDEEGMYFSVYVTNNTEGRDLSNIEYIWNVDNKDIVDSEISIYGEHCLHVTPKGKDGVVNISCISTMTGNTVNFLLKIGALYKNNGSSTKYLFAEANSVYMEYAGENITVPCRFMNMTDGELKNVNITLSNSNVCSVKKEVENDILYVTFHPLSVGAGRAELSYSGLDITTYIDYIVSPSEDDSIIYLTTSDSYVLLKTNEYKKLSVLLKNYSGEEKERISYEVENKDVCSVVGSGESVQIFGLSEGKTTVSVTHPESKNTLIINVVVSDSLTSLTYIVPEKNIIETEVSSVMDFFKVSLSGGDEYSSSYFTYKSSDTSILSVVGNNGYCYYKGLKEGVAQIEISNSQKSGIETVYVTVIVDPFDETESYLSADSNICYVTPFGNTKTIKVTYNGSESFDESKIKWYLYSEDLAENVDGNVCRINGSGAKCVVTPLNSGIAKVRCVYSPENLKLNITVFVSEVEKISFNSDSVSIYKGETAFVSLTSPTFTSDVGSLVSYTVDNKNICTALGTSKVCFLDAVDVGNTVVHAVNSYDNSESILTVNVLDPENTNNVRITTSESTVLLNPRSDDVNITATVFGNGVIDTDNDEIEWSVEGSAEVEINPKKGREVILSVKKTGEKVEDGEAVIVLTNPKCPEGYKKTIFVSLRELSDYFTLSKNKISIDSEKTGVVSAVIKGASLSDYDSLKWFIDTKSYDANGKEVEVCRLMTQTGKDCTIYGLNNGTVRVAAYYMGDIKYCDVTVKGTRYFSFVNNSISLYPGKTITIYYDQMPKYPDVIPTFYATDSSGNNAKDLVSYTIDYEKQEIELKSTGEGDVKLTGMANGVGTAVCNIYSKYNPKLYSQYKVTKTNTKGKVVTKTTTTVETINLYKDEEDVGHEVDIPFVAYPPIYYPKVIKVECSPFDEDDIKKYYQTSIVENHRDEEEEGNDGLSHLKVRFFKETPVPQDSVETHALKVTLAMYKTKECNDEDRVKDKDGKDLELTFSFDAEYKPEDEENPIVIEFQRNDGKYSYVYDGGKLLYGKDALDTQRITSDNKKVCIGDGETHYIVVKPESSFQILGDFALDQTNFAATGETGLGIVSIKNVKEAEDEKGLKYYVYEIQAKDDIGFDSKLVSTSQPFKHYDYTYLKEQAENGNLKSDSTFYPRFGIREGEWNIAGKEIKSSDFIKNMSFDWKEENDAPSRGCGTEESWTLAYLKNKKCFNLPQMCFFGHRYGMNGFEKGGLRFVLSKDGAILNEVPNEDDTETLNEIWTHFQYKHVNESFFRSNYKNMSSLQMATVNAKYGGRDILNKLVYSYTSQWHLCFYKTDDGKMKLIYGESGDTVISSDCLSSIQKLLDNNVLSITSSCSLVYKFTQNNETLVSNIFDNANDLGISLGDEDYDVTGNNFYYFDGKFKNTDVGNCDWEAVSYFYNGVDTIMWPIYKGTLKVRKSDHGCSNCKHYYHYEYVAACGAIKTSVTLEDSFYVFGSKNDWNLKGNFDGSDKDLERDFWKDDDWLASGNGKAYPSKKIDPVGNNVSLGNINIFCLKRCNESEGLCNISIEFEYSVRDCYRNFVGENEEGDITLDAFSKLKD